jgi:PAS domain S-box-containing protein
MDRKKTGVQPQIRSETCTPLASRTRLDTGTPSLSFPVVAIGASAGGLEAVRAVLAKLPRDSGMAYVVIQHLDPSRNSALAELLSKSTSMPVLEITNRITVKPNHVYVVPPNKRASIGRGTFSLAPITSRDRHHSIDNFMEGLAATLGDAGIGVVLSGMGTDGARGLAAIKAAGGFTFAQDPKSAQWPAMPVNAIEAGSADFVLPPARIAFELGRLGRHSSKPSTQRYQKQEFDTIIQILRAATGVDFHRYKQDSVARRIFRQMALNAVDDFGQYVRILRRNPAEVELLADQIFVPLTSFFRNSDDFQALRKSVLSGARAKRMEPLRVWVAGCSTGEEVYSIAILLREELGSKLNPKMVQVFGTDIRENAVQQARAGVYSPAAVAGVSPARLKRFFVESERGYRINDELRSLCVFARHDLTSDPPISNQDLIVCRNVLAYLTSAYQEQALAAFRYALKPRGFLFADSLMAGRASSYFVVKDSNHGVFSRRPDDKKAVREVRVPGLDRSNKSGVRIPRAVGESVTTAVLLASNEQLNAANEELATANEELRVSYQENIALGSELLKSNIALKALAEHLGTLLTGVDIPVVLLDARLRIVRFTSAAATLFHLSPMQEGSSFIRSASNLGDVSWDRLLATVTRRGKTVEVPFQHRNGRWYSVRMKPFGEMKNAVSGVLMVLIDEDQIRRFLVTTSNSLADSESLVGTLLDAARRSILAVDSGGKIVWANKTTTNMFGYDISEIKGQPLELLVPEVYGERHKNHEEFLAEAKSRTMGLGRESHGHRSDGTVFPVEVELGVTKKGATMLGVAFISDITERKSLDLAIRQRELELSALFDNSPDAHLRFDSTFRITHANAAFAKVAGIPAEEVVGKRLAEFSLSPYGIQNVSQAIEQVFQSGMPQQFQLAVSIPTAPDVTGYDLRFIPEFYPDGSISAVIAVGRDITQEKKVQQALRQREQELSALFNNSPDVILRVDLNHRNLYMNTAWEKLTGRSRVTALGKTSAELGLPSDAVKLHDSTVNQVLKTRKAVTADRIYRTAHGQAEYEVRYIPEFGEKGVSSILVIGRDVTEHRRLQRLATANERDIRALTSRLMSAQEQERRRFARDIHDSLCQHLGLLIAEIGSVAADLPTANAAKLPLRAAQERALRIADEARQIARQLHPAILEDLGLVKALQQLCDDFSQADGVRVAFRIRGALQPPSLEAASCAYRIAQEALNNVARHAQASHVTILLAGHRDLNLSVRDDGVGFDPAAVRGAGGLGLVSMEERARMAGGTLSVTARPGRGTRVRLIIASCGGTS